MALLNIKSIDVTPKLPLPIENLQNSGSRTKFIEILKKIDSAVCTLSDDLPKLTKELDNSSLEKAVTLKYNWDSQSMYQFDIDALFEKVREKFASYINALYIGRDGLSLHIVDTITVASDHVQASSGSSMIQEISTTTSSGHITGPSVPLVIDDDEDDHGDKGRKNKKRKLEDTKL
jgi:hypothetical protein